MHDLNASRSRTARESDFPALDPTAPRSDAPVRTRRMRENGRALARQGTSARSDPGGGASNILPQAKAQRCGRRLEPPPCADARVALKRRRRRGRDTQSARPSPPARAGAGASASEAWGKGSAASRWRPGGARLPQRKQVHSQRPRPASCPPATKRTAIRLCQEPPSRAMPSGNEPTTLATHRPHPATTRSR